MTADSVTGPVSLVVVVLGFGTSTAFLRAAISSGTTDTARLLRIAFQTLVVFAGVSVAGVSSTVTSSVNPGAVYPVLNGALSGVAFILFSRGLESMEASVAKPLLAVGTVVSFALGILVLGEQLTAIVRGDDVTAADVQEVCRQRLADYKVPREVEVVGELPKTSTRKIDKVALRAQFG